MSSRRSKQDQEESIFNLIPAPQPVIKKNPMYRSKFNPDIPPTSSTFGASIASQSLITNLSGDRSQMQRTHRSKSEHAQFGPKSSHTSDPGTFLRKSTHPDLPDPQRYTYRDTMKPKLDTHNETYRSKSPSKNKNFIKDNAIAAIVAEPKKIGNSKQAYINKPDFGKVPEYLHQVKAEVESEKQYIREILQKEQEEKEKNQPKLRLLSEEERQSLLFDLKYKWEQVNKHYQVMTHHTSLDTLGKTRRKEDYENQLQMLEKSIEKLSKKTVYVSDDN